MQQPVQDYIRAQGVTCAIINMVLNPALAWVSNPNMEFVPLVGGNSIVADTAATSLLLSLLVVLFVTPTVRQKLHAGQLTGTDGLPSKEYVRSHLPHQAWSVGLLIGMFTAVTLTPLIFGTLRLGGFSGLPFAEFALLKAVYTPALGYLVTRWVILWQVTRYRTKSSEQNRRSTSGQHT